MKVAIVEDEEQSQELLKGYLAKYGKIHNLIFNVVVFKNGLDLVSEYSADYDLIFMDIVMSFMDGIETAKVLRKLDKNVSLVFVTNMAKFAIKGYEVDAAGFLVKPFTYTEFALKMDKIIARMTKRESDAFCIKLDIGLAKVYISDIIYVRVEGRNVSLHTFNGDMVMRKPMKDVEKLLENHKFVRCDNSYLVNLAFVTSIGKTSAIVAGEEVPVSRAKRKKFMDALTLYLGKVF